MVSKEASCDGPSDFRYLGFLGAHLEIPYLTTQTFMAQALSAFRFLAPQNHMALWKPRPGHSCLQGIFLIASGASPRIFQAISQQRTDQPQKVAQLSCLLCHGIAGWCWEDQLTPVLLSCMYHDVYTLAEQWCNMYWPIRN